MAFITIPATAMTGHASAEGLTAQQAEQAIAAVPAAEWPAFAAFARAGIHTFAEWTAQFPLLAGANAANARFVIRVVMDSVGGVVVVTA